MVENKRIRQISCGIVLLIICLMLFMYLPTDQLKPALLFTNPPHLTPVKKENRSEHKTTLKPQNISCRFVYLDLGTSKGVQIRKLYEPWLYPKASLLPFYDKFFGNVTKGYRRQDVCSFGFEANPRHMKKLKHLEEAYRKKGLNVHIFNYAVSNRSGDTVNIFSQTDFELDWGAGITDLAIHNKGKMTKYAVETVDIAKFLEENILPLSPQKVFVKMDIEGSEFIVLPHLLKKKMLCKSKITEIVIELHGWAMKTFHSDLTMGKLKQLLAQQECEPTSLVGVDDESYNMDVVVDPAW